MFCRKCGKPTENANGICDECMANGQRPGANPVQKAIFPAIISVVSAMVAKMIYDASASSVTLYNYISTGRTVFLVVIGIILALAAAGAAVYAFMLSYKEIGSSKSRMAMTLNIISIIGSAAAVIYGAGVFFRFIFALIIKG